MTRQLAADGTRVRVVRTPVSAHAFPIAAPADGAMTRAAPDGSDASPASPAPPDPRKLLDLLARGVWALALQAGVAAGDSAPSDFDPIELLDRLARSYEREPDFPFPRSPALGGAGGGRVVAEDGSPGVPGQWVRWMMRPGGLGRGAGRQPAIDGGLLAPLLAALRRLAREAPLAWLVYRDRVLRRHTARAVAADHRIAEGVERRELARARSVLLAHLALLLGQAEEGEHRAMVLAFSTPALGGRLGAGVSGGVRAGQGGASAS